MKFDATKRTSWLARDVRRANFRYEIKLYALVSLIVGIPFILILWALLEVFGR